MTENAQLALINMLPIIIAALFAGIVSLQLRHIKHLTNSALTIQTQRATDAEAATKEAEIAVHAAELLAKRLVDEELIRLKATVANAPPAAVIVAGAPIPANDKPVEVKVVNPIDDPANVKTSSDTPAEVKVVNAPLEVIPVEVKKGQQEGAGGDVGSDG